MTPQTAMGVVAGTLLLLATTNPALAWGGCGSSYKHGLIRSATCEWVRNRSSIDRICRVWLDADRDIGLDVEIYKRSKSGKIERVYGEWHGPLFVAPERNPDRFNGDAIRFEVKRGRERVYETAWMTCDR